MQEQSQGSQNSQNSDSKQQYMGIGELTERLKNCLQHFFNQVTVRAEVGSVKLGKGGHYYLSLKEGEASISGMIWSKDARSMSYLPKSGDEVLVNGSVSMRPNSGQATFYIKHLIPTGAGLMQAEFDRTYAEFKAQGLFDRARSLPLIPKGVGLITSVGSSAYHDFLKSVNERAPGIPIYLVDVKVQGIDSLPSLTNALRMMYQDPRIEVIAMTRGGGSLEDLWTFNHRDLCLLLARSPKPTVVGIGHEDNVLIAELVADVRGHTPTKVAETIFPKTIELNQNLYALVQQLNYSMSRIGMQRMHQLQSFTNRLLPLGNMEGRKQYLKEMNYHLDRAIQHQIHTSGHQVESLSVQLHQHSPQLRVERAQHKLLHLSDQLRRYDLHSEANLHLEQCQQNLFKRTHDLLREKETYFNHLVHELELLSPLKTLGRGYSLVKNQFGEVVQHAQDLSLNDEITITLSKGEVKAQVTEIKKD